MVMICLLGNAPPSVGTSAWEKARQVGLRMQPIVDSNLKTKDFGPPRPTGRSQLLCFQSGDCVAPRVLRYRK
jgi:hypothetical protein